MEFRVLTLFLCETKNSSDFVGSVYKKAQVFLKNWETYDPVGRKEGLMVAWKEGVDVKQIQKSDFCLKVQMIKGNEQKNLWIIFLHASTDAREKKRQWDWLKNRSQNWGSLWIMGEDFNNIINSNEKKWGKARSESSFQDFRNFIDMNMGEIKFRGEPFTWANNRKGKVLSKRDIG